MAKTASESAQKFVERSGAATQDYVAGAESTTKDQAQLAIAGKENWKAGLLAAQTAGRYEKGLAKSGKAGWQRGVREKGSARFAEGVASSASKYAENSGKYDGARGAANSLPRGPKGSEANYARSKAVGQALRKTKVGV